MQDGSLRVTDSRTNNSYEFPIQQGTVRAMDLRQMKTSADDFGLMTYDPAFMNTASCRSAITYIDGDRGILRYRGYPIEVLAEKCTFLEVAYLLLFGELPNAGQLNEWTEAITARRMLHETTKQFLEGFRYDAHPMAMFISTVAALSTVYKDSGDVLNPECRLRQAIRLIGKVPTISAYTYRHSIGYPYVYPDEDLPYAENFMNMLWKNCKPRWTVSPVLARALDILFILHADHEQNCSTNVMRAVGSSQANPFLATAAAAAALSGPLHGGANEEVLHMIDQIGTMSNIPAYIEKVKRGECRLMGFGHRVYKNYDPRARIIKWAADQVFNVTGRNPKLDIALELEKIALSDEYFVKRKLYPNVDFYSGIMYQAMGFQPEMFTVLFAIPRTVGWLAQWLELMQDPEQKIARPRQIYTGYDQREFIPIESRNGGGPACGFQNLMSISR